ncbi:exonuclease SbcCD subunit D [Marisediminicola senii]|uniref:exonuclease SbcCD subunit D n=1 Tax=Marisediminicola senii TaxID=2711233 RepID=UPI0013EBF5A8|nr:exonuclease SbcCD subunit D [Marisediminicola senii]
MRILHTSDWHIGRTFHGTSTIEPLRSVLTALVAEVIAREVDVVVVAGDIFDSATPAAEYYSVLTDTLRALHAAGAVVVMTSGNHDSATRLGFQAEFAGLAGIHICTRPENAATPITVTDEHGPVHFYGIPYLEPSLVRHLYPGTTLRTHEQVLANAMTDIRADLAERGGRSVVVSHCFAVGVPASDVERDITSGGIDLVPAEVFDGPDYVALGHIHSRNTISDRVRYSGAPLHYSFSEAGKPRGGWLFEVDATGLVPGRTEWVSLPIPRDLVVLTGELDDLLGDAQYARAESSWVSVVLTDRVRPMDGMRRLQERFPWCVRLDHRPVGADAASTETYTERLRGKDDQQIVADFLGYVRGGVGPTNFERRAIADAVADQTAAEALA